jgi:hypothetical protein
MRSAITTVPTLMAAACQRVISTPSSRSAVEATMPAAAGVGSPTK